MEKLYAMSHDISFWRFLHHKQKESMGKACATSLRNDHEMTMFTWSFAAT